MNHSFFNRTKLYSKTAQSQHLYPKIPLNLAISKIPVGDYLKDPAKFISTYRGHGARIAELFMDYRNRSTFTLTNHNIARTINCDPRVVRRWTARFVEDGWLIKKSKDYNANVYKIMIDSKSSYAMFMVKQPDKAMFLCNQVISVKHQSVLPNRDYIYILPSPISSYTASARNGLARDVYKTKKREAERAWFDHQQHVRVVKAIKMLTNDQKQFIQLNKKQPQMKELLSQGNKLRNELFSPSNLKLVALMELNEIEQIKLLAFSDELIEVLCTEAEKVKAGTYPAVRDRAGWLFSRLNKLAQENGSKPHWMWVFDVCEILALDPRAQAEARPMGPIRDKTPHFQGRDKTVRTEPKVNATTREYVKTHEWKGHVEVPRKVHDNDKLRGYLLEALNSTRDHAKYGLQSYPLEVQELSYDLLATENSCYCIELSRKGRWVLENNTCKHKRRDDGEMQTMS